ncbi:epoxyqueuosine reductase [Clostridium tyrobutyricum]|uniref:epoxyqueuosine reductase n=1 Tax=Clostridium tyrobutyricum TaxID=1519 RepID=UPI001C38EC88|nr:epoxyqueuosine reductase [Clostridium tyrobutyricum]MBV4420238.1 epoxyqueuosine reductase [Clostridium tyrobutyricum]
MSNFSNKNYQLKYNIVDRAKKLGMNIVGFASVDRWEKYRDTNPEYYPQNIWPGMKTVIVFGTQIYLPMLETTPSIVYSELYNTTNRILDETAYKIANYLNTLGHQALFFPRDCYGDISVLVRKPAAAFSQVLAAKYAGLGTIGYNHTLLTKEFGPRVRLVSVITNAVLPPDPMLKKDLCIKCEMCRKCCPTISFTTTENLVADMNKKRCAEYHAKLKAAFCYPCGVCIKVCPVGDDRKVYGYNPKKYLKEREVLRKDKNNSEYAGWVHCRNHGSNPIE